MAFFRCYFIGTDRHIQTMQVLESANDDDAIRQAQGALADQGYPTFELWDGKRRVHIQSKAVLLT